jgi:hypothetical protein
MNSSEFDRRFEEGESVIDALDLSAARRPRLEQRRVNVDFPIWMVEQLDLEASRLGVTRQSIIKVWLAERLERHRDPVNAPDRKPHCPESSPLRQIPPSSPQQSSRCP